MPRLISRSPSESKSTTRSAGRARARPSAKPACPPIAGSPTGTSRVGRVLICAQCRPPRPGTTMASPRWGWKIRSMSAVWNKGALLAVEPVVLVGHQDRDRPLRAARLLDRDGDARGVGRGLDRGREGGRDREREPLPADRHELQRRVGLHELVEEVGLAVGEPHHVGDPVLLHLVEHELRAELRVLGLGHGALSHGSLGHGLRVSGGVAASRPRTVISRLPSASTPTRSPASIPVVESSFSPLAGPITSPPIPRSSRRYTGASCHCPSNQPRRRAAGTAPPPGPAPT